MSNWAGEVVDLRFRFRSGFQGSIGYENETYWSGLDGFAFDNIEISKQQTSFTNIYDDNQPVTVNNLEPGDEIVEQVPFNFEMIKHTVLVRKSRLMLHGLTNKKSIMN